MSISVETNKSPFRNNDINAEDREVYFTYVCGVLILCLCNVVDRKEKIQAVFTGP